MMFKKIFLIIFLIFHLTSISYAKDIHVYVKGMVCSFCAQGIEKKFINKTVFFDVDLLNKIIFLKFKDGQELSNEEIKKKIEEAGFFVERIEQSN